MVEAKALLESLALVLEQHIWPQRPVASEEGLVSEIGDTLDVLVAGAPDDQRLRGQLMARRLGGRRTGL